VGFRKCLVNVDLEKDTKGVAFEGGEADVLPDNKTYRYQRRSFKGLYAGEIKLYITASQYHSITLVSTG
jgi:hypothetical protein